MYCTKCGKETLPGVAFCRFCGQAAIPSVVAVATQQPSPVTKSWARRHPVITVLATEAGLLLSATIFGGIVRDFWLGL